MKGFSLFVALCVAFVAFAIFMFFGCLPATESTQQKVPSFDWGSKEIPKADAKLTGESVITGEVRYKYDRTTSKRVDLRDWKDGSASDVRHSYWLDIRAVVGDHDEYLDLRVSKEVFDQIKERQMVSLSRRTYDDGTRSYELVSQLSEQEK